MALQKTITRKGVLIPDCYIKVKEYSGNKSAVEAVVSYKASSTDEDFDTASYNFGFDLDGPNIIEQLYNHLKLMPEFDGAVDC